MGGTDRFDQQLSYYKSTIKTKRWQPRIFTHFISAAWSTLTSSVGLLISYKGKIKDAVFFSL